MHGSPPSKGLLLGTELQGVEAIVSGQVTSEVGRDFAAWQPMRAGWT